MEEQPIIMQTATPRPDLMPEQAFKIIEKLKDPDKRKHPDHIAIIGESGSGRSTICSRIINEIDAIPLVCDGYELTKCYGACNDQQVIKKSVLEDLILPTIAEAQQAGKSRAVLIIPAFELLYHNQNKDPLNQNKDNPIRYLLRVLNPANFTHLKPPLLIINEFLPLKIPLKAKPVEGENIIHIEPPSLEQRRLLIRYWVERNQYICDQTTQENLVRNTDGQSITTISLILRNVCLQKAREKQQQQASSSSSNDTDSEPVTIKLSAPSTDVLSEADKVTEATRLVPPILISVEASSKCYSCVIS